MEVMVPVVHGMDFDFNSARTTPYPTAPSTPRRVGEYYSSAPTSPRRIADFYREFDNLMTENGGLLGGGGGGGGSSLAEVPFDWEEKPGVPKSHKGSISMYGDDFAFDISGEMQMSSLSAEELFDGGVIKPLKPPPRLQVAIGEDNGYSGQASPVRSPRKSSPLAQGKNIIRGAFSPREKKDVNTFGAAIEDIRIREPERRERGRERSYPLSSSSRRAARSVSPIRVSEYQWADDQYTKQSSIGSPKPPSASATSTLSTFSKGIKWKLKDLFLFRSASDGRAMAKDPLKKYSTFVRKHEDLMNGSSRSIESNGKGSTSSRRRGKVSAHEKHYTVNRAYSEDMKKKTFLPYKQGILGRLSFNPTVSYSLGFNRNQV